MPSSRSLVTALALAMTCAASTAVAQSSAPEASDHHRAGVAYAKSAKWEQAVREFDEAYKLDPSPLRLYDVAQVCVQAKQFVRARDAFAKVKDNPALSSEQQQRARAGLATARENIGRVHVSVVSAKPSDVVTVDDAKVRTEVVEVDPGKHTVKLASDADATEVIVDVPAGGDATATLVGKKKEERPAVETPAEQPATAGGGGPPVLGWIFGGVAVAALGSGIPLTVIGHNDYAEIEEDPCARDRTCGGRDRGPRQMTLVGEILIGVGIVAAAAAVYFFVTSVDRPRAPSRAITSSWRRLDVIRF